MRRGLVLPADIARQLDELKAMVRYIQTPQEFSARDTQSLLDDLYARISDMES